MEQIISCDWGTSALRLRVIHLADKSVLTETTCDKGILTVYNEWKQSGKNEEERLSFYQSILNAQIKKSEQQSGFSLDDMPVVISGMASSNIGMSELPYKEMPFSIDGNDLEVRVMSSGNDFRHNSFLVSGAKTSEDVMRGEETQLIGGFAKNEYEEQVYIFPGTHSKHILVKNNKAVDIRTYMTGEFFELLSKKSILFNDINNDTDLFSEEYIRSFENGVAESIDSNLLHNAFLVRTNSLLGKLSKEDNYYYLSGLLIGTELKELISTQLPVSVVSNQQLAKLYKVAFTRFGVNRLNFVDSGETVVNGHCKIYYLYK
jgi:2-dehydro-3-deoxygalactonokinase